MQLEEVLRFIRAADTETWDLIVREMRITRKRRGEVAAANLRVGRRVRFEPGDPAHTCAGFVERISRGRVMLRVSSSAAGFERLGVPASMLRQLTS